MSDPNLLGYIGAITGVVGAITGIAGAIMGYVGYRRSVDIKSLELRIELRKSISDLFDELQEIPRLLDKAKKSHTAVAAATGQYQSGAMQGWLAQWEADQKSLEAFEVGFTELNVDHSRDAHETLETNLVETHSLLNAVRRLREKYELALASDDRERDHIREDIRAHSDALRNLKP